MGSLNDFRESLFTAGTLGALNYIVNGMAELPGRKSVIMFSDGLKIFNQTEGGSFAASRTMAFLQNLVAEANRHALGLDAHELGRGELGDHDADRIGSGIDRAERHASAHAHTLTDRVGQGNRETSARRREGSRARALPTSSQAACRPVRPCRPAPVGRRSRAP